MNRKEMLQILKEESEAMEKADGSGVQSTEEQEERKPGAKAKANSGAPDSPDGAVEKADGSSVQSSATSKSNGRSAGGKPDRMDRKGGKGVAGLGGTPSETSDLHNGGVMETIELPHDVLVEEDGKEKILPAGTKVVIVNTKPKLNLDPSILGEAFVKRKRVIKEEMDFDDDGMEVDVDGEEDDDGMEVDVDVEEDDEYMDVDDDLGDIDVEADVELDDEMELGDMDMDHDTAASRLADAMDEFSSAMHEFLEEEEDESEYMDEDEPEVFEEAFNRLFNKKKKK